MHACRSGTRVTSKNSPKRRRGKAAAGWRAAFARLAGASAAGRVLLAAPPRAVGRAVEGACMCVCVRSAAASHWRVCAAGRASLRTGVCETVASLFNLATFSISPLPHSASGSAHTLVRYRALPVPPPAPSVDAGSPPLPAPLSRVE